MKAAGQLIELLPRRLAVPIAGQIVQQLGKTGQAAGDLPRRVGRDVAEPAIEGQGDHQQHTAKGHRRQLGGQLLQRGWTQLQKHESHGIADVPLWGELTAPPQHQPKGDHKVEQDTQPQALPCRKGQQAQKKRHQADPHIVARPVGLPPPHLKQGSGTGHHHGIGRSEQLCHQQKLDNIK